MIPEAMLDNLRIHSGKLFGTWAVGTLTWAVEATNVIGLIGALVGLFAGVMLTVIRWDDFTDSNPIRRLRGLPRKPRKE